MPNGYRLQSLLLPLALLLASCDDSETTRPAPQDQPEVLAQWARQDLGGQYHTPGDVLLTADGRQLYVVPLNADRHLLVLDRDTGSISRWELPIDPANGPTALASSPSGDILCVLYGYDRVVALFSGNRELIRQWSIPKGVDVAVGRSLTGIAYNAVTEEVAVADLAGHFLRIYRLDGSLRTKVVVGEPPNYSYYDWFRIDALASGDYLINSSRSGEVGVRRLSRDGLDLGLWKGDEDLGPSLLRVGCDGNVYLRAARKLGVQRRSPTGELLGETILDGPDRLIDIISSADATSSGEMIIGDAGHPAVHDFSPSGRYEGTTLLYQPAADAVGLIRDIAVGSNGDVYATDVTNSRVIRVTVDSGATRTWGGPGTTDRPLRDPDQIVLLADGSSYVIDTELRQLRHYTSDGVLTQVEPDIPGGFLAAGDDWIYVSDGRDIYRRPLSAGPANPWQPLPVGWKVNLQSRIRSIEVDGAGRLYAFEYGYPRSSVLVMEPDGEYVRTVHLNPGTEGFPTAFAVDDSGRIFYAAQEFVAQGFGGEFYVIYDEHGRLAARWHDMSNSTVAIDVDATGKLYLARNSGEIVVFAAIP